MKTPGILLSVALLSACTSVPSNQISGNDLSHISLRDKRMAEKQVQVVSQTPTRSSQLGMVESERCQGSAFSEVPDEKILLMDLKIEAYRMGANAITDVKYETRGAVSEGCWNIFRATANMLAVE